MKAWMKDWIKMIDTTDDTAAAKGIKSHNFQAKEGFPKRNFRDQSVPHVKILYNMPYIYYIIPYGLST